MAIRQEIELTKRQFQVLAMVKDGLSYKEIAYKLDLSESTIKNHLTVIRLKLKSRNTIEAITTALSKGWITMENVNGN